LYFDANDKEAYLKLARGYKNSNASVAKEYLEKLVAIDPDYIPAYAEIGDLYGISSIDESKVNYTKALAAYEKFISIPGVPTLQQERYAQILYFTDNYEKSLQHINSVLKTDPENAVMHRLQGYNNYKLGNVELSVQQLAKFLQEQPADKHIYLDYITYGHALADAKQPEAAVEAFLKAAALNPAKPEIYKELAVTYTNAKNYPEAIKAYEKYFELEPEPSATDKYFFGQTIYYAASKYIAADYAPSEDQKQTDDATFNAYIEKGNVAFADVIKRSPDSYLGYFWRARLNTFVDLKTQETKTSAMQGVAKPYFEEAVEVMLKNNEDGKRNKDIIEAYRYLASYYLLLDDNAAGGEYFKKILLIDPANVQAKETLDALHIKY
jgi:tetratricopeptide (TPR) repeat protein